MHSSVPRSAVFYRSRKYQSCKSVMEILHDTRWYIRIHWAGLGIPTAVVIYLYKSHKLRTNANFYMNLAPVLFFRTSGCLCTLGIRPSPMALRIAFAIFLWFLGRRPVSLECFIRPVSVMYSDIMVKFCGVSAFHPHSYGFQPTLYSCTGLIPRMSKASL